MHVKRTDTAHLNAFRYSHTDILSCTLSLILKIDAKFNLLSVFEPSVFFFVLFLNFHCMDLKKIKKYFAFATSRLRVRKLKKLLLFRIKGLIKGKQAYIVPGMMNADDIFVSEQLGTLRFCVCHAS